MVARGEVGLVVVTILKGTQLITAEQYIMAIVVIVLTTIAAPIMLSVGFALQDRHDGKMSPGEFSINIGLFETVGIEQMFNIILDRIEALKRYTTTIDIIEGQRIALLDGQDVKIVLMPQEGIIMRGNRRKIDHILVEVKRAMAQELEAIEVGHDE